ncbi:MAG: hypothetical protein ACE15D_02885 [Candidatus Eisenbacteria bacterium]
MNILISALMAVLLGFTGSSADPGAVSTSPDRSDQDTMFREPVGGYFHGRIDGIAVTVGYCVPDQVLDIDFDGVGVVSFLGRCTMSANNCSDWTDPELPFEGGIEGDGTVVAANGDELYMTVAGRYYVGSLPPTTMTITGTYTVTGGTGRFSDATGSGQIYGEQELLDLYGHHETWFSFDGTFRP